MNMLFRVSLALVLCFAVALGDEVQVERKANAAATDEALDSSGIERSMSKQELQVMGNFIRDGAAGDVCTSWGDTHMIPFSNSGPKYNIYHSLPFIMTQFPTRNRRKRFEVQATQTRKNVWGRRGATADQNFAIFCGKDLVVFKKFLDHRRPLIFINGRNHARQINRTPRKWFPSAPNGRYTINEYSSRYWFSFRLNCNHRQFNPCRYGYAAGFEVHVSWFRPHNHPSYRRRNPNMYIYGNAKVQAARCYYRRLKGACGWFGGWAKRRRHFISWRSSAFTKHPRFFAKHVKAGRMSVSDPAHLRRQVVRCRSLVQRVTGLSLRSLHARLRGAGKDGKSLESVIKAFIRGCAVDYYYGLTPDTGTIRGEVCDFVSLAKDKLNEEIRDGIRLYKKSCNNAVLNKLRQLAREKLVLGRLCGGRPTNLLPVLRRLNLWCKNRVGNERRTKEAAAKRAARGKAEAQGKAHTEAQKKAEAKAKAAAERKRKQEEKGKDEGGEEEQHHEGGKQEEHKQEEQKQPEKKCEGGKSCRPNIEMSTVSNVVVSQNGHTTKANNSN